MSGHTHTADSYFYEKGDKYILPIAVQFFVYACVGEYFVRVWVINSHFWQQQADLGIFSKLEGKWKHTVNIFALHTKLNFANAICI